MRDNKIEMNDKNKLRFRELFISANEYMDMEAVEFRLQTSQEYNKTFVTYEIVNGEKREKSKVQIKAGDLIARLPSIKAFDEMGNPCPYEWVMSKSEVIRVYGRDNWEAILAHCCKFQNVPAQGFGLRRLALIPKRPVKMIEITREVKEEISNLLLGGDSADAIVVGNMITDDGVLITAKQLSERFLCLDEKEKRTDIKVKM